MQIGNTRWQLCKYLDTIAQWTWQWDPFSDAFHGLWQFGDFTNPIFGYLTAVVDSTHMPIQSLLDPLSQWFDKPKYRRHALVLCARLALCHMSLDFPWVGG